MTITSQEIRDHAVEVEFDEGTDEFYFMIVHPPTCFAIHLIEPGNPFCPRVEHPRCPIEYEWENVGLNRENFDCEAEWPVDLFRRHAESGEPLKIEVYVTYGWTASTYLGPSEYEWEFMWKPLPS